MNPSIASELSSLTPIEAFKKLDEYFSDDDLKTSENWSTIFRHYFVVRDPDGWDRQDFKHSFYEEKISFKEFRDRALGSTLEGGLPIEEKVEPESEVQKKKRGRPKRIKL